MRRTSGKSLGWILAGAAALSMAVSGICLAETEGADALHIGSLKGPTTMGLVNLMKAAQEEMSEGEYTFTMETQAETIAAGLVSGDLDIALVPANLAAVLYKKTEGNLAVLDINTLGVLYCVTGDDSIHSVKDLAGKTVYSTGQGTTPEYVLNYLLAQNEVTDCTVEFKSEATEVAALLAADPSGIAILPQPFVTVAEAQNEALMTAFSLTEEWEKVAEDGSRMVTGVTVVRRDVLKDRPEAVQQFLEEQEESASRAVEDVEGTAELVAEFGIIEKAPIAAKALPNCSIVCITGEEMQEALSGYLTVLYEAAPEAVGGALPDEAFYYLADVE